MQFKMKIVTLSSLIPVLTIACAPATPASAPTAPAQVSPSIIVPIVATLPPTPKVKDTQTCPAKDLQYLVGQRRVLLHTMRFGSEVRIEEPGQAYTEEFSPTRTRIVIDAAGRIQQVICG
jgi:Peptidase inhibitor I78 family